MKSVRRGTTAPSEMMHRTRTALRMQGMFSEGRTLKADLRHPLIALACGANRLRIQGLPFGLSKSHGALAPSCTVQREQ